MLLELATERFRTSRLQALAEYSNNNFLVLGHDCIPITTVETVAPGMGSAFAAYLSAVAHAKVLAPTSEASEREFMGWKMMLPSRGLGGPRLQTVTLPEVDPKSTGEDTLPPSGNFLSISQLQDPLILAVGSHEPRKNHLALLVAAEILWEKGFEFSLVFVGGNSWSVDAFDRFFSILQGRGRNILRLSQAPDSVVSLLYRRARFTVFPSLNEGFGLPIVESLAAGTPVITSDFGSMRQLASRGGCLTVNPRNVSDLANAMQQMLTDDEQILRLREEAGLRLGRDWEEYATDLWEVFFDDAAL